MPEGDRDSDSPWPRRRVAPVTAVADRIARAVAVLAPPPAAEPVRGRPRRPPARISPPDLVSRIKAYVALTKPRIVELLLVTTLPAMLLAHRGVPPLGLMVVVLVGGALAAGAANALNCYLDRDIDALMRRTSRRPLPAHAVSPRAALTFGLALAATATALMATFTNPLATALTVAAIAYYDLIYTWWLKRTTRHNTFWGGVSGAMPVLIGWAAVTGSLAWPAVAMFAIVFFWQLPHFYALAARFKDDYSRAGIPMLPVVAGLSRVGRETVWYAWLTLAASLSLVPLGMTWRYGVAAVAAGGIFVGQAHRMHQRIRRGEQARPMRLFHWSNTYLTLIFLSIAVDVIV